MISRNSFFAAWVAAVLAVSVIFLSATGTFRISTAAGPDSRLIISVPWGRENFEVGRGSILVEDDPAYGFHPEGPFAVREAFGGRLLVVDTAMARVKVYAPSPGGKPALERNLEWRPGNGPGVPLMIDAVQDSHGNYHVLDGASRGILLFDRRGNFKKFYGEFGNPQAIAADRRGRIFVLDSGLGGVIVFGGPDQQWAGTVEGRHLCAVVDGNGNIYGLKEMDGEFWVTVIPSPGDPGIENTFAVCRAPVSSMEVLGFELSGVDESGAAHVVFVQGRDGKPLASFDARLGQGVNAAQNLEIGTFLEMRSSLPRMYTARADGSLLTFSDMKEGFNVLAYGP